MHITLWLVLEKLDYGVHAIVSYARYKMPKCKINGVTQKGRGLRKTKGNNGEVFYALFSFREALENKRISKGALDFFGARKNVAF